MPEPGQPPEEALERVHLGARGWRVVGGPAGTLRQPVLDRLVLVGEVVVQNGVGRPSYENLL